MKEYHKIDTVFKRDPATNHIDSRWGIFRAEGIVARPAVELKTRNGSRIITKIKHKDFALTAANQRP